MKYEIIKKLTIEMYELDINQSKHREVWVGILYTECALCEMLQSMFFSESM